MMQVAAEDTHDNYVICRGFDPRSRKFFDYDEDDENKPGIPIAKPYGLRGVNSYEIGQIFPALIPVTRIGQSSGVAETTVGHPADLDEEVEILYTDDDKAIAWLLLDTGYASHWGKLDANLVHNDTTGVTVSIWTGKPLADSDRDIEEVLPPPTMEDGTIESGEYVRIVRMNGQWYVDMPDLMPPGTTTNDIFKWNATTEKWGIHSAPSTSGTFVLTVTSGTMAWTELETFVCP